MANEDTMLRTHCCGHKCFPVCPRAQHLLRTQNLCPRHKNVSDFFQKHFVSATNVSRFAQHRNNHEQQCVRNIVSSFATTLMPFARPLQFCFSSKICSTNQRRELKNTSTRLATCSRQSCSKNSLHAKDISQGLLPEM